MEWFEEIPVGIEGKILSPDRITTLEEILLKTFGSDIEIVSAGRLRSKKNGVVHLKLVPAGSEQMDVVAKMFIEGRYENELSILRVSTQQGLAVPRLLMAQDGVILMDFISGEILVDRINRTFDSELITKLAEWYYKYHTVHRQIKADPRLRNFICHDDGIVGVDFEESHSGHWMIDIGGVCASLLDTNPIFDSRKRTLSWHLLDTYLSLIGKKRNSAIETMFITTIADTLKQTATWRNDSRIQQLSEQIRTKGLPRD